MIRILFAVFLSQVVACSKEDKQETVKQPTTMELITGGPWLLTAYGFDDDSTGAIEDHENLLQPCQQDNTIMYHSNGTGTSFENQLQCGGDTLSVFEWKFIDSEKAIEVLEKRMDLHKLDQRELHFIIQEPFLLTPLHASYKRLP